MADGLKPWLEDSISTSLSLGHRWIADEVAAKSKRSSNKAQNYNLRNNFRGIYDDDFSSLDIIEDITSSRDTRLVVIKQHPLTLTDGLFHIQAEISPSCENVLRNFHDRVNLQPLDLYSVISVQKHTIRYTAYGPPSDQLILILELIRYKGKGNVEDWCNTQSLLNSKEITVEVGRLQAIRAQQDYLSFRVGTFDPSEAMAPYANRNTVLHEEPLQSQTTYSTQERAIIGDHTRPSPHIFENNRPTGPNMSTNTDHSSDLTKRKNLLSMLDGTKSARADSSVPNDHVRMQAPKSPIAVIRKGPDIVQKYVRPHPPDPDMPPLMPPSTLTCNSSAQGKSNGQNNNDSRSIQPRRTVMDRPTAPALAYHTPDDVHPEAPAWMSGYHPTVNSVEIGRQGSLLSRKECWHKPPPGCHFPPANIPIEVLEALKKRKLSEVSLCTDVLQDIQELPQEPRSRSAVDCDDVTSDEESDAIPTSWSTSPEPEQRPSIALELPPDSSNTDGNTSAPTSNQISPHIGSQNPLRHDGSAVRNEDTLDPPDSSPPPIHNGNDTDDEMDLDVPRALGEDHFVGIIPNDSLSQLAPVVQVKDTPYTEERLVINLDHGLHQGVQHQKSSDTCKDTSSASIIPCTFKETARRADKGPENTPNSSLLPPPSSVSGDSPLLTNDPSLKSLAELTKEFSPKQLHSMAKLDVPIHTVPPDRCYTAWPMEQPHGVSRLSIVASPHAHLEPTPVSAQCPVDGSSSGRLSQCLENVGDQLQTPQTKSLGVVQNKRKLQCSPSTSASRLGKRRQIKIVGFDSNPSFKDTNAQLRRIRDESIQRARQESAVRCSEDGMPKSPENTDAHTASIEKQQIPYNQQTPHRNRKEIFHQQNQSPVVVHMTPPPVDVLEDIRPRTKLTGEDVHVEAKRHGCASDQITNNENTNIEASSPMEKYDKPAVAPKANLNNGNTDKPDLQIQTLAALPMPQVQQAQESLEDSRPQIPVSKSKIISVSTVPGPSTAQPTQVGTTTFTRFQAEYPDYRGDSKHFSNYCKKIYELDLDDRMVPKWQWDDYLIRSRTHYWEYMNECIEKGTEALPYIRFYKDTIRDTLYTKGVLDGPSTVAAALEELGVSLAQPEIIQGRRIIQRIVDPQTQGEKRRRTESPDGDSEEQHTPGHSERDTAKRSMSRIAENARGGCRSSESLEGDRRKHRTSEMHVRVGDNYSISGSFEEDTDKRRSSNLLDRSNGKYRSFAKIEHDGIKHVDPDRYIRQSNKYQTSRTSTQGKGRQQTAEGPVDYDEPHRASKVATKREKKQTRKSLPWQSAQVRLSASDADLAQWKRPHPSQNIQSNLFEIQKRVLDTSPTARVRTSISNEISPPTSHRSGSVIATNLPHITNDSSLDRFRKFEFAWRRQTALTNDSKVRSPPSKS